MVKPEELRIGNWILTENNIPIKVHSIFGDRFNFDSLNRPDYGFPLTEMNGIILTTEILQKAGFILMETEIKVYYLKVNRFTFCIDFYNNKMLLRDEEFRKHGSDLARGMNGLQIPNLHQLQNIHFLFTGQELEIII